MKKKILCFLPILLFIFLFSGCNESQTIDTSNAIIFAIAINADGGVCQSVSLPTQEEQLSFSETQKEKYINDLTLEIKRKLFFPYFYNYFTISASSAQAEYKIGGQKLTYIQPTYDEEKKIISFSFDFADSEAWEIYHPSDESEDNGLKIEKGFFINLGKADSDFVFGQKLKVEGKEVTLGEYFHNVLSTIQAKYKFENLDKPRFIYEYTHFSGKIHTNADKKVDNSGKKVNAWVQSYNDLGTEKKVEIFVYSPNRAVWYGLTLGGTILIMVIAWLIHGVLSKKKEKREKV